MSGRQAMIILLVLTGAPLLSSAPVQAQSASDGAGLSPGGAGGHGGRHGGSGRRQRAAAAGQASPDLPAFKRDPTQRLDAGATLCGTEAALLQHEAAIVARLNGGQGDEPTGCRIVPAMTAVAVVTRHGLASTQVMVPGPPQRIGWTDAVVRDGPVAR